MRVATLLAVALLSVIHLAGAQVPGPDVDADHVTLFAHTNGDDSVTWINTVQDDPDGDPATVTYYGEPALTISRDFPLEGAVAAGTQLDPEGDVVFQLYAGAGCCANVGTWTVKLVHAGETLAEASTDQGPEVGYSLKSMTVPLALEAPLMLTADLVWTVAWEGGGTAFMQVGQSGSFSNLVLPILPMETSVGPRITYSELDGDEVSINGSFAEPSSDAFVYNWTQEAADLDMLLVANGTGTLNVVIADGNGTEVVNGTFEAGTHTDEVRGAAPGSWVVQLGLDGFNGSYELALAPPGSGDSAPGGGDDVDGGGSDAGNDNVTEDGNLTGDGNATADGKESPAVPALLLGTAIVALAAIRRRRD